MFVLRCGKAPWRSRSRCSSNESTRCDVVDDVRGTVSDAELSGGLGGVFVGGRWEVGGRREGSEARHRGMERDVQTVERGERGSRGLQGPGLGAVIFDSLAKIPFKSKKVF